MDCEKLFAAYEVLGIRTSHTSSDVTKAYRALALQNHPDHAPTDKQDDYTVRFQILQNSYEIIKERLDEFPSEHMHPPPLDRLSRAAEDSLNSPQPAEPEAEEAPLSTLNRQNAFHREHMRTSRREAQCEREFVPNPIRHERAVRLSNKVNVRIELNHAFIGTKRIDQQEAWLRSLLRGGGRAGKANIGMAGSNGNSIAQSERTRHERSLAYKQVVNQRATSSLGDNPCVATCGTSGWGRLESAVEQIAEMEDDIEREVAAATLALPCHALEHVELATLQEMHQSTALLLQQQEQNHNRETGEQDLILLSKSENRIALSRCHLERIGDLIQRRIAQAEEQPLIPYDLKDHIGEKLVLLGSNTASAPVGRSSKPAELILTQEEIQWRTTYLESSHAWHHCNVSPLLLSGVHVVQRAEEHEFHEVLEDDTPYYGPQDDFPVFVHFEEAQPYTGAWSSALVVDEVAATMEYFADFMQLLGRKDDIMNDQSWRTGIKYYRPGPIGPVSSPVHSVNIDDAQGDGKCEVASIDGCGFQEVRSRYSHRHRTGLGPPVPRAMPAHSMNQFSVLMESMV